MEANVISLPAWVFAVPAIGGALGITFLQYKKGDLPINIVGKIILAWSTGFFLGQTISTRTGLDRLGSSFAGAGLMPVLLSAGESYVRSRLKVTSKDDKTGGNDA